MQCLAVATCDGMLSCYILFILHIFVFMFMRSSSYISSCSSRVTDWCEQDKMGKTGLIYAWHVDIQEISKVRKRERVDCVYWWQESAGGQIDSTKDRAWEDGEWLARIRECILYAEIFKCMLDESIYRRTEMRTMIRRNTGARRKGDIMVKHIAYQNI